MISAGDAVCTTTPLAGRGVTLALVQARALIRALDHHGTDIDSATTQFDQWCTENIRPWFDDHVRNDADRLRRWSGGDVDTTRCLPSDLIVAAAMGSGDVALRTAVEPYARMGALLASLDPVEPRATEIFAAGWRPDVPTAPNSPISAMRGKSERSKTRPATVLGRAKRRGNQMAWRRVP
jgi:hypothetical protein